MDFTSLRRGLKTGHLQS